MRQSRPRWPRRPAAEASAGALFKFIFDQAKDPMRLLTIAAFVLSSVCAWPAPVPSVSTWPQWRGPTRDGQFVGSPWPERMDTNALRLKWRMELGPSYSGPVVSPEMVFTTETREKKREAVVALDRASGKQIWRVEWDGAISVPFFAKANGDWIRSTPAWDGANLYVAGMRDVLVCLDAATGRERWRYDFVQKLSTPVPEFGFVCSPLVEGDSVFVQAGAAFVRLNKHSGELIWRTLIDQGGMWGNAFSSPILTELAGRRQLVVQTREKVAGIEPKDGTVLWEQPVEAFRGMNILTPVVRGDLLFTSTYGGKTIGFKVTSNGGAFRVSEAWRHKAQGYMSTPVVVNGVAYHHLKSQRVMAIELETGRDLWTSDSSFGKYWSLVAQGDRMLALDQRGLLLQFRANREKFELLDQRRLTQADTWAHLAVVEEGLFVRELNALTAYEWHRAPLPGTAAGG